jgi:RNA polymerase sigma-70 factor (ECF subfamily)
MRNGPAPRMTSPTPSPTRHLAAAIDGELMRLVGLGDPEAMKALYDRTAAEVYEAGLAVVRRPADAEDIVQDVFLQVWTRARAYDPARGTALAWLTTIATHCAIDALRRALRREQCAAQLLPPPEAEGPQPDAPKVREGVQSLTAACREPLWLAYFEGLSQTEVADRLKLPLGTVKTRTRRALRELEVRLRDPPAASRRDGADD